MFLLFKACLKKKKLSVLLSWLHFTTNVSFPMTGMEQEMNLKCV